GLPASTTGSLSAGRPGTDTPRLRRMTSRKVRASSDSSSNWTQKPDSLADSTLRGPTVPLASSGLGEPGNESESSSCWSHGRDIRVTRVYSAASLWYRHGPWSSRSEERRVGKEWRGGWSRGHENNN